MFRALFALTKGLNARNVSFQSLYGRQFTLSTQLINPKFCVSRPHRRSTTVSLETNPLTCVVKKLVSNERRSRLNKAIFLPRGYCKSLIDVLEKYVRLLGTYVNLQFAV